MKTEMTTQDIDNLFGALEDLDPRITLCEGGLCTMASHPLVHTIYSGPRHNAMINRQLEHKLDSLRRAQSKKDWHSVVFLHERPYRLEALIMYKYALTNETFSKLAHDVWTDSENTRTSRDQWIEVFTSEKFEPAHAMNASERDTLRCLNTPFTVYRGASSTEGDTVPYGLSWSLSKITAEWFANRWGSGGVVRSRLVSPHEVVMYSEHRGEREIVLSAGYLG